MNHDLLLELCAGYALDSLDADDRATLEAHLSDGCAECQAALVDFRLVAGMLGAAETPRPPAPQVKERILDAIAAGPAQSAAPTATPVPPKVVPMPERPSRTWNVLLAAAALALALTTVFSWNRAEQFRSERDTVVTQLAQLQEELGDAQRWLAVATSSNSQFAVLQRTPDADASLEGWVTFAPTDGDAIVVLRNAAAPTQRDYELWALRAEGPVSLGVVQANADGLVILRLDEINDPDGIAGFAVSLEPDGGSPQAVPTGPVVLAGQLGG